jgi:acid phosphatase type 7
VPARTTGQRFYCLTAVAIATVAIAFAASLPRATAASDPVIAAAGDIACGIGSKVTATACHQTATSNMLLGAGLAAVLPLGDLQYERGAPDAFAAAYDPSWGRVKSITRPVPGNHEYGTAGASGYFSYFGSAAGTAGQGYYSYDVGSWHMIALNSNCGSAHCGPGSAQLNWLQSDLATHESTCTLAYWHHPHFSSGPHGDGGTSAYFWAALHDGGADVVLNGHDHDYERFAPQNEYGEADPAYGLREFVVGTGGRSHYQFSSIKPNSEVRNADTFGVLLLTLHKTSYSWRFAPEPGKTFTDSGTANCHGAPGAPSVRISGSNRVRLSRSGTLSVRARCATTCAAQLRAIVVVGRRKIRSAVVNRTLSPGPRAKLRFKFSKGQRRALKNALKRHRRLAVTVNGQSKDPAGNLTKVKLSLQLRR